MPKAAFASLVLARFDEMTVLKPVQPHPALFLGSAGDMRAARSNFKDLQAFKFAIYGLHETEESARSTVDSRLAIAPWLADADEVFAAVLRPFRHYGEANFLDSSEPGPVFDVTAAPPTDDTPIVIVTSVGWQSTEGEAMERIMRFSEGVAAVRIGMTGLPGLHSQQTFSFPGGLVTDGITVTFWDKLASAMAFAYGPGLHRKEVKTQREGPYGDRTSFTRFQALHHEGTWHGSDPLAPRSSK